VPVSSPRRNLTQPARCGQEREEKQKIDQKKETQKSHEANSFQLAAKSRFMVAPVRGLDQTKSRKGPGEVITDLNLRAGLIQVTGPVTLAAQTRGDMAEKGSWRLN